MEAATADELLKFIETPGGTEGILAALEGYKGKNEVFDLGAEELKTVATICRRSAFRLTTSRST